MAHICYDCKLGYGHPLFWCPGCGRSMTKVKNVDWQNLRKNNWKLEGEDVIEYYLDGKLIEENYVLKPLYDQLLLDHPWVYKVTDIKEYNVKDGFGILPKPFNKIKVESDRIITLYLEIENQIKIYFDKPYIRYRLAGSNLPIGKLDKFRNEVEFDKSRI